MSQPLWRDALGRMLARADETGRSVTQGFPHFADPATGPWTTSPAGEPRFLEVACRAADWWLAHAPRDRVSFWDFDDPAIPRTSRDTSATAIVTASLLKLGQLAPTEAKRRDYREAAEETAEALVRGYLTPAGILTHGCYNKKIGLAPEHELIWGSYYLFESLHVLAGRLAPTEI